MDLIYYLLVFAGLAALFWLLSRIKPTDRCVRCHEPINGGIECPECCDARQY